MTPKVKALFKAARNNHEFLKQLDEVDPTYNPYKAEILMDDIEKHLFVMCYYGWLMARTGVDPYGSVGY